LNKNDILKIIERGHEEFEEINGTKRSLNDQRVEEFMF